MTEVFPHENPGSAGQGPKMARDIIGCYEKLCAIAEEALEAFRFLMQQGLRKSWERFKEEGRFLYGKLTAWDYICGNLGLAFMGLCALVVAAGFGILGYQTLDWLKDGVWDALPLMVVFNFLFENTALHGWMTDPESWVGLHQLLQWVLNNIPVSLVLILNGLLMGAVAATVMLMGATLRRLQLRQRE